MKFTVAHASALGLITMAMLTSASMAQQVRIYGGLSNFDVYNETGDDCNEFEFELDGPHPEDVYHTYHNGNYGAPRIESLPGNTGIRVIYSHPAHATHNHAVEHFGASLRGGALVTGQRFRWISGGIQPPTPPANPPLPTLSLIITTLNNREVVLETLTNTDEHNRPIWVKRKVTRVNREVSLEELMPNDPLIQSSTDLDAAPVMLDVGEPIEHDEQVADFFEQGSQVISYDVWLDSQRRVGNTWIHEPGVRLGMVMNASLTQRPGCDTGTPTIITQPTDTSAWLGAATDLYCEAESDPNYGELFYQWRHESVDLPGEDNPRLELDPITPESAGTYTCILRNDCGFVMSYSAHLTVISCDADYNKDNAIDFFDYLDFVGDFADGKFWADFNDDGILDFFDYLDYVSAFANGC